MRAPAPRSLTTKTTLESLNGLISKDDEIVKLEGCGEAFEMYSAQTEDLQEFVHEARARLPAKRTPAVPFAPEAPPDRDAPTDSPEPTPQATP